MKAQKVLLINGHFEMSPSCSFPNILSSLSLHADDITLDDLYYIQECIGSESIKDFLNDMFIITIDDYRAIHRFYQSCYRSK